MSALQRIYRLLDNSSMVRAIRQGLIMTIPLLLIGSFALIFKFLPLPAYQRFLQSYASGALVDFFTWTNQVTFGVMGLCSTISISYCYARDQGVKTGSIICAVFVSVSASMIFNGFFTDSFDATSFGAQGMFTAIFSSVVMSKLFCFLIRDNPFSMRLYTVGADSEFNNAISVILPAVCVISAAYLFNQIISALFQVASFEALFHKVAIHLFQNVGSSSGRTLLYVILSSILWFFGIHGTNVLKSVELAIFPPGSEAAGIITKPFIDAFVFMGGCGVTIGLLVAILVSSKQKNVRGLGKMALLPMMFNINELIVFGLPIVYNQFFLLPFILAPLACAFTGYVAIWLGLVPQPQPIEWVTPLLLGGYQATGSLSGTLLQLFNIAMSATIYRWFLVRYERYTDARVMEDLQGLISLLQEAEREGQPIALLDLPGREGRVAKMLAEDFRHVMDSPDFFELHYQPQFDNEERCCGAEALLRWNHPLCGMIYPPLMVCFAREQGVLGQLERNIFLRACQDIARMQREGVCPPKVSVNVTAASLQSKAFPAFLEGLVAQYPQVRGILCIELTEQMSFLMGDASENKLQQIRDFGITFAVDDFSMGHTSFKYLQSNLFDMVKLDGSLIRNILENSRSQEIVSSIIRMSRAMNFSVIAEFVERKEQRLKLEELGCLFYQGYHYSPAVPLESFLDMRRAG